MISHLHEPRRQRWLLLSSFLFFLLVLALYLFVSLYSVATTRRAQLDRRVALALPSTEGVRWPPGGPLVQPFLCERCIAVPNTVDQLATCHECIDIEHNVSAGIDELRLVRITPPGALDAIRRDTLHSFLFDLVNTDSLSPLLFHLNCHLFGTFCHDFVYYPLMRSLLTSDSTLLTLACLSFLLAVATFAAVFALYRRFLADSDYFAKMDYQATKDAQDVRSQEELSYLKPAGL